MPEKLKLAVIGWPLRKTLSPNIFSFLFENAGIKGEYRTLKVKPSNIEKTIKNMNNFSGFNVTTPFKEKAFFLSDFALKDARVCLSANMIKKTKKGILAGNSDAKSFGKTLSKKFSSACVLGSGGAASAVLMELGRKKFRRVYCISGKRPTAFDFISRSFPKTSYVFLSKKARIPLADIYINARISIAKFSTFPKEAKESFFYDLNYNCETDFLKKARMLGAETKDGLEMLFLQAVESLRFFSGFKFNSFEIETMKKIFLRRFIC